MHTILMPVDGNTGRAMNQAKTITTLPLIRDEIKVLVINVLDEDASINESSDMLSPDRVDSITQAKDYLESEGILVEVSRISGNPAEKILEVADEVNVDGIFVGGRKRSPAGKAIFGSTSQKVILNADCPVTITTKDD